MSANAFANKIIKTLNVSLMNFLGVDGYNLLRFRISSEHELDLLKYEDIIEKPELFEQALTDILGDDAKPLLKRINEDLARQFSLDPESSVYSRSVDFSKLINRIKSLYESDDLVLV